jgi:hypothetical protein
VVGFRSGFVNADRLLCIIGLIRMDLGRLVAGLGWFEAELYTVQELSGIGARNGFDWFSLSSCELKRESPRPAFNAKCWPNI